MRLKSVAPIRISLFGGGTDVGEYASKYGGVCINMAINIYQRFILGDGEKKSWSFPENADSNFYKAFFKELDHEPAYFRQKFDGFIHGGLGTSASAAVALVAGLSKIKGQRISRYSIAEKAWEIEVNKLGLFGGKQDQFAAAFGGFNLMKFEGRVEMQAIPRGLAERLAEHILLFDTGIRRTEPKLQENLEKIDDKQKRALDTIKSLANDAYDRIYKGDIKGLGKILDDTWTYKKESNKVTTPSIDAIYDSAKKAGALGGKICGSGGGGYMIFLAEKDKHQKIKDKLGLNWVDFSIDWNGAGANFI